MRERSRETDLDPKEGVDEHKYEEDEAQRPNSSKGAACVAEDEAEACPRANEFENAEDASGAEDGDAVDAGVVSGLPQEEIDEGENDNDEVEEVSRCGEVVAGPDGKEHDEEFTAKEGDEDDVGGVWVGISCG